MMETFNLIESLNYLSRRFSKRFENTLIENFKKAGFDTTIEKWIALAFVRYYGDMNQQQIGELLNMDKTAITRLMNYFENDGCVQRELDKSDKRNKLLKITPRGNEMFEKLSPVVLSTLSTAYRDISQEEINITRSVLMRMFSNMKN